MDVYKFLEDHYQNEKDDAELLIEFDLKSIQKKLNPKNINPKYLNKLKDKIEKELKTKNADLNKLKSIAKNNISEITSITNSNDSDDVKAEKIKKLIENKIKKKNALSIDGIEHKYFYILASIYVLVIAFIIFAAMNPDKYKINSTRVWIFAIIGFIRLSITYRRGI